MYVRRHPEKGPWVGELEEGAHLLGFYLARDAQAETFRDPSRGHFLRLKLVDRTGEIDARIWEAVEDYLFIMDRAQIVKVEGHVESFHGRPQVKVLRLRSAQESEYELGDLIRSTDRDPEAMLAEIDRVIAELEEPHLAALLAGFFGSEEFREAFRAAPAARRIHHAYLGGLLEHVFEILQLARPLLELYPQLNRDLLVSGILLHDVGKLEAFTWELDIDYTDRGRLLGHVVMSAERVAEAIAAIPDFPPQLALELQHLVVSHHGRYEWGSPRRPKTLEAAALHHLENLDSQVNRFKLMLESAWLAGEPWTHYDRLLGRTLYAGEDESLSIEERAPTE